MKHLLIIDTSILCIWLDVPGMEICGPGHDRWDKMRVEENRVPALHSAIGGWRKQIRMSSKIL